ncbi:EpsG family protein [Flavobacterium macacae]|uniref:EpsG family protein n=1 Tax=Flavobacterium macacae TaxID=2488993 RepID=A0A3P3W0A3_9FLAO|nr:EpsG family protein [Flavobacterium macacae]RRJ88481.1 EpsG family protein [Flavobacterium macacae]
MYLILALSFFLVVFFEVYGILTAKKRASIYVLICVILIFHDGLRWEMATDFKPYLDHFLSINYRFSDYDFEIAYTTLVYLINSFFGSYTLLLLLLATIVYTLYYSAFKIMTPFLGVAFLIYYTTMIGMLGSNRQLVALALCFYAIQFIVNKKIFYFAFTIGAAFLFHKTAIIMLPFYFLNSSFKNKYVIICFVICIILSYSEAVMNIFEIVTLKIFPSLFEDKSNAYLSNNDEFSNSFIGTIFGILRKLIPVIILFYLRKNKFQNDYFNIISNLMLVSLFSYILFNNNLQFLVGRLTIYFSIYECIVYSWFMFYIAKNKPKLITVFFLVLFLMSFVFFNRSIAIYPELFIPYRSVLTF